jgi:hypothetical protein
VRYGSCSCSKQRHGTDKTAVNNPCSCACLYVCLVSLSSGLANGDEQLPACLICVVDVYAGCQHRSCWHCVRVACGQWQAALCLCQHALQLPHQCSQL